MVSYEIVPFQLVYITNDEPAEMMATNSHSALTILRVTRDHVIATDLRRRRGYQESALYQSTGHGNGGGQSSLLRSSGTTKESPDPFPNGTKIAFTGTVNYETPRGNMTTMTTATRTDNWDDSSMYTLNVYASFLGGNATLYVDMLQLYGWKSLIAVHVMTMSGNVMMDEGQMRETSTHGTTTSATNGINRTALAAAEAESMNQHLSYILYLSALGVPLAVVGTLWAIWFVQQARHRCASRTTGSEGDNDDDDGRRFRCGPSGSTGVNDTSDWHVNSAMALQLHHWTRDASRCDHNNSGGSGSGGASSSLPNNNDDSRLPVKGQSCTKAKRAAKPSGTTTSNSSVVVAIDGDQPRRPSRR